MQKAIAISALALTALLGAHAHSHETHDHETAPIITTIKPLHSLVSAVLGDSGEAQLLIQGKASPHGYQLKPSQVRDLQEAAVLFYIAPDLELFLAPALASLPADVRAVSLIENDQLQLWPYRLDGAWAAGHEGHDHGHGHDDHDDHDEHHEDEHDEHGHDEHGHDEHGHDEHGHDEHGHDEHGHDEHAHDEHGHDEHAHDEHAHDEHAHDEHDEHDERAHDEHAHDEHAHDEHDEHDEHAHDEHDKHDEHAHDEHGGQADPHIWLSPSNAKVMASAIAAHLSSAFPEHRAAYRANLASLHQSLDQLDAELRQKFSAVSGRNYLVFHDAYQYLEQEYQLGAVGAISLDPEQVSSPARLRAARANLADKQISCVFSEPQFPTRAIQTVISGTDTRIGELDPLGAELTPGANLYNQLLHNMADNIVACLQ